MEKIKEIYKYDLIINILELIAIILATIVIAIIAIGTYTNDSNRNTTNNKLVTEQQETDVQGK